MAVGEWDQRQLCPDGGCVGVIGPDGVCKVCGRAALNWGDERKRGLIDPPDENEDEDDEDDDEDGDLAADAADDKDEDEDDEDDDEDDENDDEEEDDDDDAVAASSSPGDWGSRQLCPDGACIGLIGPDGKCKVCGRAASDVEPASAPVPAVVSAADPASAAVGAADPAPAEPPGAPASDAASDAASPDAVTADNPAATKGARCADATCSGVSGPDGRCDVCGKVVP